MGKRVVRIIAVRRWMTAILLVMTTSVMAGTLYFLSGRAYAAGTHSTSELVTRVVKTSRGEVTRDVLIASLMPIMANMLFFVPWGFLTFILLDTSQRSRRASYLLTAFAAAIFAAALMVWQEFLPTRVTAVPDAIASIAGAVAGGALAHARKSVHVRFEF